MKTVLFDGDKLQVHDETQMNMFRVLTPEEKAEFRDDARLSDTVEVNPLHHPIWQDEMIRRTVNGGTE